jgi:hypothetical protein
MCPEDAPRSRTVGVEGSGLRPVTHQVASPPGPPPLGSSPRAGSGGAFGIHLFGGGAGRAAGTGAWGPSGQEPEGKPAGGFAQGVVGSGWWVSAGAGSGWAFSPRVVARGRLLLGSPRVRPGAGLGSEGRLGGRGSTDIRLGRRFSRCMGSLGTRARGHAPQARRAGSWPSPSGQARREAGGSAPRRRLHGAATDGWHGGRP